MLQCPLCVIKDGVEWMTSKVYTLSGHQLVRSYLFTLVARRRELKLWRRVDVVAK